MTLPLAYLLILALFLLAEFAPVVSLAAVFAAIAIWFVRSLTPVSGDGPANETRMR